MLCNEEKGVYSNFAAGWFTEIELRRPENLPVADLASVFITSRSGHNYPAPCLLTLRRSITTRSCYFRHERDRTERSCQVRHLRRLPKSACYVALQVPLPLFTHPPLSLRMLSCAITTLTALLAPLQPRLLLRVHPRLARSPTRMPHLSPKQFVSIPISLCIG